MEFLGFTLDIAELTHDATTILIKVILALAIFIIGKWLAKKLVALALRMMSRSRLDDTVAVFLSNVLYGILLVVVTLAALNNVGIHTTSVVAILGGAAVAVGLSLKDQLSNFAAGVLIVTFRPFVRGDFVKIGNFEGIVKEITLVNTHLTSLNNHEIIIPNSDITKNATLNYTSLPNRRVDITLSIGYSADIKTVKDIMLQLASEHPLSFSDPAPIVRVTKLGESAVDLTLNVWATNGDWWTLNCELLEQFRYALDHKGIGFPLPQRNLNVTGLESLVEAATTTQPTPQVELSKETLSKEAASSGSMPKESASNQANAKHSFIKSTTSDPE